MRVLVTNDDGIASVGLHALAVAVLAAGHDVVVAAPAHDHSGYGAAIGPLHLSGQVAFERVGIEGLDGVEAMAVDGPPGLAVMAGCLGGFGPSPDVVASGINAGANTGRAILHSGTVGAALTAVNFGVPAVAVSLALGDGHHWVTAAEAAAALLPWVGSRRVPLVLNVNVPDRPLKDVAGVEVARLDAGGVVQAAMDETHEGVLQMRLAADRAPAAGTDTALLGDGVITASALRGMHVLDAESATSAALLRRVLPRAAVGAVS